MEEEKKEGKEGRKRMLSRWRLSGEKRKSLICVESGVGVLSAWLLCWGGDGVDVCLCVCKGFEWGWGGEE